MNIFNFFENSQKQKVMKLYTAKKIMVVHVSLTSDHFNEITLHLHTRFRIDFRSFLIF